MWESRPEVGSIDRAMSVGFWGIDIFTSRTVEFDCFLIGDIGETDGEEGLGVTVDSRTSAEICFSVFLELRQVFHQLHFWMV